MCLLCVQHNTRQQHTRSFMCTTNVLIKIITTVGMTFVEAQPNLMEKI